MGTSTALSIGLARSVIGLMALAATAGAITSCAATPGEEASARLAPAQDTGETPGPAPSARAFLDAYAQTPAVQMYETEPITSLAELTQKDGATVLHGTIAGTGADFVRIVQTLDSGTDGIDPLELSARYITIHVDRTGGGETIDVLVPVWSGPSARDGHEGPESTEAQLALLPVGADIVVVGRSLEGVPGYVPVQSTGAMFLKDQSGWLSASPVVEEQAHGLTDAELVDRVSSSG